MFHLSRDAVRALRSLLLTFICGIRDSGYFLGTIWNKSKSAFDSHLQQCDAVEMEMLVDGKVIQETMTREEYERDRPNRKTTSIATSWTWLTIRR